MIQELEHNTTPGGFEIKAVEPPPEPDYDILEPAKLSLFRDKTGKVRATVAEDRSFLDVRVVRCFPQTNPDRFWALTDRQSRVIGIVQDPDRLDNVSRNAAEDALRHQYFLPVITAVYALKEEFGAIYFDVDTDRGRRSFVAKGVRDAVEERDDGEIVLVDVDENRYVIPDWTRLDPRSRKHIERIV